MSLKKEYNIFNLNPVHKALITKYISFIKSKQNAFIKEVSNYISDFSNDNVIDTMYSKEDIEDMFVRVQDYIKISMEKEISYYLNMNGIFVQLLLHDAENQTITLQVEVPQIENMTNIKEMNDFISSLSNLTLPDTSKGNSNKLGSVSNTINLIENYETLKHDYDILTQEHQTLQKQNEMLVEESKNLQQNAKDSTQTISDLRNQIKMISSGMGNKDNKKNIEILHKLEAECAEAKKNLDEQISKYQALVKEFDKKVSQSVQFKQLKKLLQDKNTLIVQLKTKVAKYEEK